VKRPVAILALGAVTGWAGAAYAAAGRQGGCTPPAEMRSKLAGRPTADALNDLGVWFANGRQYTCAAQAFATSLQNDPQQPPFRRVIFMFGASLFYSGEMKEAAEALQEAERVGYRDEKLYAMLATALDAQHETEKAEAQWKLALAFDPESVMALDGLSNDMMALRQFDGLLALLTDRRLRALRSEQQVQNLGAAYVQLGRAEEAAKVLEDGLNTYPGSSPIANQLVTVLTALHRDTEAALVCELAQAAPTPGTESGR
jgi:tetratricopeptide (TPR) repeat protein